MPLPPTELRLAVPLDEHEASYLAASAKMASLRWTVCNEEDKFESYTVLIYSVLDFRATGVPDGVALELDFSRQRRVIRQMRPRFVRQHDRFVAYGIAHINAV